jgi:NitT/TauT family transport system permease protein
VSVVTTPAAAVDGPAAASPPPSGSPHRSVGRAVRKVVLVVGLVVVLAALWELYKVVWQAAGWTWPVRPDDTSMPHTWSIVGALFEPARRGGEDLYGVILARAAWATFREAVVGFVLGTVFGLGFALLFLKWALLRRGLMPYLVVSQTIPLIAIAPMVVIWVRSNGWPAWFGVAAISAYLTFFPVTVNMLRGLTSPSTTSLELMRSFAATDAQVLTKLRLPASLPYLFTALKIGATASVVGALVGELPAGLQDGLGRALLNGAQYFITRPEQLFAAVLVTALLGLAFAGAIGLIERLVIPHRPTELA